MLRKLLVPLVVIGFLAVLTPAWGRPAEDPTTAQPQVVSAYTLDPIGFHADFDDGTSVDCTLGCMLWIDPVFRWNFTVMVNSLSTGQCGGDLPPCRVMGRESGGDVRVWNGGCYAPPGWTGNSPCGVSSASGKWQIVRGTWGGYAGYTNAADAPEYIQDELARIKWAGGAGCSHWGEC